MKSEMKIEISNAKITKAEVMSDGTCRLDLEIVERAKEMQKKIEYSKDALMIVKASELSLNDSFMKHKPETNEEKKLKEDIKKAIKLKIADFYCFKYDPSFSENETAIRYVAGERPAVGKSWNWWNEFKIGTELCWSSRYQRAAFLGVLIKELIKKGWSVKKSWHAVCNDSKELGHFWDSENAKHKFEPTGSREICGFCDLGNTYKILGKDDESGGFGLAGGDYKFYGNGFPLASLVLSSYYDFNRSGSVPWFVLKK